MRLFIAVNFNEEVKNKISSVIEDLKVKSQKGNFTKRENLHLTLVFIGETSRTVEIQQAMDKVDAAAFRLSVNGSGKFKRFGGDIYWLGIEKNMELSNIYSLLYKELKNLGFELEDREFKPHLTLGREVVVQDGFDKENFKDKIPEILINISKISLMKSERINGKLTYTEIYWKELAK